MGFYSIKTYFGTGFDGYYKVNYFAGTTLETICNNCEAFVQWLYTDLFFQWLCNGCTMFVRCSVKYFALSRLFCSGDCGIYVQSSCEVFVQWLWVGCAIFVQRFVYWFYGVCALFSHLISCYDCGIFLQSLWSVCATIVHCCCQKKRKSRVSGMFDLV